MSVTTEPEVAAAEPAKAWRRWLKVIVAAAVVLLVLVVGYRQLPVENLVQQRFSATATQRLADLDRCVTVSITGTLRARAGWNLGPLTRWYPIRITRTETIAQVREVGPGAVCSDSAPTAKLDALSIQSAWDYSVDHGMLMRDGPGGSEANASRYDGDVPYEELIDQADFDGPSDRYTMNGSDDDWGMVLPDVEHGSRVCVDGVLRYEARVGDATAAGTLPLRPCLSR